MLHCNQNTIKKLPDSWVWNFKVFDLFADKVTNSTARGMCTQSLKRFTLHSQTIFSFMTDYDATEKLPHKPEI